MHVATTITTLLLALSCAGYTVVYDLSMTLHVPRVYDNFDSLGRRSYQTQRLVGVVTVKDGVTTVELTNKTHKVNGVRVTYDCLVDDARWQLVGSNNTGVFKKSSVSLIIEALPSYVPAYEPTEDETLVITLAGAGTRRVISGFAAGSMGCGCSFYGHVSPTRDMFTMGVVDTASVWGTWRLTRKRQEGVVDYYNDYVRMVRSNNIESVIDKYREWRGRECRTKDQLRAHADVASVLDSIYASKPASHAHSPVVKFALGAASVGAGREMVSRKINSLTSLFADQDGEFDVGDLRESVLAGFAASGPMPFIGGIVTVDRSDAERFFNSIQD